jgi:DNA-binding transcriptional LysR family regulator
MDLFQAMKTFACVVESGSFTGAADRLSMSKAAISRQINELEQHLGVRLLQRSTRSLSVTSDGDEYLLRCREVFAALEQAEQVAGGTSDKVRGRLRISAPLSFGMLHLAPLWGPFAALHPGIALDIVLTDRVIDLVDEGFDLAIRIARLPASELVSRTLAHTRLVLCASPAYLERHGALDHPRDLAGRDVISYSYHSWGDTWTFQGPTGPTAVVTRPRFQANNGDTCRVAAIDGHGIVLLPEFIVYRDLADGSLVELLDDYQSDGLDIQAVYPTRKQLPLRVRKLVDYLIESFAAPVWAGG